MTPDVTSSSDYIRQREAFFLRVDLSEYLIDYYLHRKDVAPGTLPEHDEKLKQLIACFALHLTARTAFETHAWTLHIVDDEPYSLFVTGTTGELDEHGIATGYLVGHVLTDNIRHSDVHSLHAQCTYRGQTFASFVRCESSDIPKMVETFYDQSEQRPIRISISDNDDTAQGLAALPGIDDEWFRSIELPFDSTEPPLDTVPMRKCRFTFSCDCSSTKLLPFLMSMGRNELEELFGEDPHLVINCPRCGRRFQITRDELLADDDST
jgi:molecular chaperone Hsp33